MHSIERGSHGGDTGIRLQTASGPLFANNIFIATSGYTSRATPVLQKKITPIGSFMIATERLPDSLARELSPRQRMIYDSKHYLYYYRFTPDTRMLLADRRRSFRKNSSTTRRSAGIVRRGMIEVCPQLRNTKVEYVWGGTSNFCFDTMPHAGTLDGMYYAVGYAGQGVAIATYLGARVAAAMLGHPSDNPYADIPFPGPPLGLYSGTRWFLPLAGAYYKVLDWIS